MRERLRRLGYHDATYEDEVGRVFSVMLPPDVPDSEARSGVLLGPVVDFSPLRLPLALEVHLHNALQSREIFTHDDARRQPESVRGALMSALKVDARRVIESYRLPAVD